MRGQESGVCWRLGGLNGAGEGQPDKYDQVEFRFKSTTLIAFRPSALFERAKGVLLSLRITLGKLILENCFSNTVLTVFDLLLCIKRMSKLDITYICFKT